MEKNTYILWTFKREKHKIQVNMIIFRLFFSSSFHIEYTSNKSLVVIFSMITICRYLLWLYYLCMRKKKINKWRKYKQFNQSIYGYCFASLFVDVKCSIDRILNYQFIVPIFFFLCFYCADNYNHDWRITHESDQNNNTKKKTNILWEIRSSNKEQSKNVLFILHNRMIWLIEL